MHPIRNTNDLKYMNLVYTALITELKFLKKTNENRKKTIKTKCVVRTHFKVFFLYVLICNYFLSYIGGRFFYNDDMGFDW